MRSLTARIPYWTGLVLCLAWAVSPVTGQSGRRPSLQQLVKNSDFIVVGAFKLDAVDSSQVVPYVSGVIIVEEVLWGDLLSFLTGEVVGREKIPVGWQAEAGCEYPVNWTAYTGRKGIWLLINTDADAYRADGPRYLALKNKRKVIRSLHRNRVFIRRTPLSPSLEPRVDLVVRNARRHDAVIPDFNFQGGVLYLHPEVSLTVFQSKPGSKRKGELLTPLQGGVLSLDEEEWIVVASGEEHLVRLNLAELFDLNRESSYTVKFRVAGFGKDTLMLPAIVR